MRCWLAGLVAIGVLTGCSSDQADTAATTTTSVTVAPPSSSPTTAPSESTTAEPPSELLASPLRHDGFAGMTVGMAVAEAEDALGENIIEVQTFGSCADFRPTSTTSIGLQVLDGEIALISTDAMQTDAGIGVGASEAEIRAAYPDARIEADTNRLTIYQVLVRPPGDDQHATLFLFRAGGESVERIKAGSYPEIIEYDEGCA